MGFFITFVVLPFALAGAVAGWKGLFWMLSAMIVLCLALFYIAVWYVCCQFSGGWVVPVVATVIIGLIFLRWHFLDVTGY